MKLKAIWRRFEMQNNYDQTSQIDAADAQTISEFCDKIVDADIVGRIDLMCQFRSQVIADYKAEAERSA